MRLAVFLLLTAACCVLSFNDNKLPSSSGSVQLDGLDSSRRMLQQSSASDRLEEIGVQMMELMEQLVDITETMFDDVTNVTDAVAAVETPADEGVQTLSAPQEILEGMLAGLRELLDTTQTEELRLLSELRGINTEIGQRLDEMEGKSTEDAEDDIAGPGPPVVPTAMAAAEAAPIELMPIFDEPPAQTCMKTSEVMQYYSYAFGGLLVQALDSSGLDDVLDAFEVSFTLFAPTSEGLVELARELNMSPKDMVKNSTLMRHILEYHIYPGVLSPADLLHATDPIPTMQFGRYVTASTSGGRVTVMGLHNNAYIGDPREEQYQTCNGVIYLARQALIPSDMKQVRDEEYLRQRIMELESQLLTPRLPKAPRSPRPPTEPSAPRPQARPTASMGRQRPTSERKTPSESSSSNARSSILSDQLLAIMAGARTANAPAVYTESDQSEDTAVDEGLKAVEAMELINRLTGSNNGDSAGDDEQKAAETMERINRLAGTGGGRGSVRQVDVQAAAPFNGDSDGAEDRIMGRLNYDDFVSAVEGGTAEGAGDERSQRIATTLSLLQQMQTQQAQEAQEGDISRRGLLERSSSEDEEDLPLFLRMAGYRSPEPGSKEEEQAIRSLRKRDGSSVDRSNTVIPDLPPLLAVSEIFRNDGNIGGVDDEILLLARAIASAGNEQAGGVEQGIEQLLNQATSDQARPSLSNQAQDGLFGMGGGALPGLPQSASSAQMGAIPEMGALPLRLSGLTGMIPGLG